MQVPSGSRATVRTRGLSHPPHLRTSLPLTDVNADLLKPAQADFKGGDRFTTIAKKAVLEALKVDKSVAFIAHGIKGSGACFDLGRHVDGGILKECAKLLIAKKLKFALTLTALTENYVRDLLREQLLVSREEQLPEINHHESHIHTRTLTAPNSKFGKFTQLPIENIEILDGVIQHLLNRGSKTTDSQFTRVPLVCSLLFGNSGQFISFLELHGSLRNNISIRDQDLNQSSTAAEIESHNKNLENVLNIIIRSTTPLLCIPSPPGRSLWQIHDLLQANHNHALQAREHIITDCRELADKTAVLGDYVTTPAYDTGGRMALRMSLEFNMLQGRSGMLKQGTRICSPEGSSHASYEDSYFEVQKSRESLTAVDPALKQNSGRLRIALSDSRPSTIGPVPTAHTPFKRSQSPKCPQDILMFESGIRAPNSATSGKGPGSILIAGADSNRADGSPASPGTGAKSEANSAQEGAIPDAKSKMRVYREKAVHRGSHHARGASAAEKIEWRYCQRPTIVDGDFVLSAAGSSCHQLNGLAESSLELMGEIDLLRTQIRHRLEAQTAFKEQVSRGLYQRALYERALARAAILQKAQFAPSTGISSQSALARWFEIRKTVEELSLLYNRLLWHKGILPLANANNLAIEKTTGSRKSIFHLILCWLFIVEERWSSKTRHSVALLDYRLS